MLGINSGSYLGRDTLVQRGNEHGLLGRACNSTVNQKVASQVGRYFGSILTENIQVEATAEILQPPSYTT